MRYRGGPKARILGRGNLEHQSVLPRVHIQVLPLPRLFVLQRHRHMLEKLVPQDLQVLQGLRPQHVQALQVYPDAAQAVLRVAASVLAVPGQVRLKVAMRLVLQVPLRLPASVLKVPMRLPASVRTQMQPVQLCVRPSLSQPSWLRMHLPKQALRLWHHLPLLLLQLRHDALLQDAT